MDPTTWIESVDLSTLQQYTGTLANVLEVSVLACDHEVFPGNQSPVACAQSAYPLISGLLPPDNEVVTESEPAVNQLVISTVSPTKTSVMKALLQRDFYNMLWCRNESMREDGFQSMGVAYKEDTPVRYNKVSGNGFVLENKRKVKKMFIAGLHPDTRRFLGTLEQYVRVLAHKQDVEGKPERKINATFIVSRRQRQEIIELHSWLERSGYVPSQDVMDLKNNAVAAMENEDAVQRGIMSFWTATALPYFEKVVNHFEGLLTQVSGRNRQAQQAEPEARSARQGTATTDPTLQRAASATEDRPEGQEQSEEPQHFIIPKEEPVEEGEALNQENLTSMFNDARLEMDIQVQADETEDLAAQEMSRLSLEDQEEDQSQEGEGDGEEYISSDSSSGTQALRGTIDELLGDLGDSDVEGKKKAPGTKPIEISDTDSKKSDEEDENIDVGTEEVPPGTSGASVRRSSRLTSVQTVKRYKQESGSSGESDTKHGSAKKKSRHGSPREKRAYKTPFKVAVRTPKKTRKRSTSRVHGQTGEEGSKPSEVDPNAPTMPEEYKQLLKKFPNLRLVPAPKSAEKEAKEEEVVEGTASDDALVQIDFDEEDNAVVTGTGWVGKPDELVRLVQELRGAFRDGDHKSVTNILYNSRGVPQVQDDQQRDLEKDCGARRIFGLASMNLLTHPQDKAVPSRLSTRGVVLSTLSGTTHTMVLQVRYKRALPEFLKKMLESEDNAFIVLDKNEFVESIFEEDMIQKNASKNHFIDWQHFLRSCNLPQDLVDQMSVLVSPTGTKEHLLEVLQCMEKVISCELTDFNAILGAIGLQYVNASKKKEKYRSKILIPIWYFLSGGRYLKYFSHSF